MVSTAMVIDLKVREYLTSANVLSETSPSCLWCIFSGIFHILLMVCMIYSTQVSEQDVLVVCLFFLTCLIFLALWFLVSFGEKSLTLDIRHPKTNK